METYMLTVWDHQAEDVDELSIKKGDVIKVKQELDEGWWIGELDGKIGLFPVSYCKRIEEEQQNKEELKMEDKFNNQEQEIDQDVYSNDKEYTDGAETPKQVLYKETIPIAEYLNFENLEPSQVLEDRGIQEDDKQGAIQLENSINEKEEIQIDTKDFIGELNLFDKSQEESVSNDMEMDMNTSQHVEFIENLFQSEPILNELNNLNELLPKSVEDFVNKDCIKVDSIASNDNTQEEFNDMVQNESHDQQNSILDKKLSLDVLTNEIQPIDDNEESQKEIDVLEEPIHQTTLSEEEEEEEDNFENYLHAATPDEHDYEEVLHQDETILEDKVKSIENLTNNLENDNFNEDKIIDYTIQEELYYQNNNSLGDKQDFDVHLISDLNQNINEQNDLSHLHGNIKEEYHVNGDIFLNETITNNINNEEAMLNLNQEELYNMEEIITTPVNELDNIVDYQNDPPTNLNMEPIIVPQGERKSLDITYSQFAQMYLGEEEQDNEILNQLNESQLTIDLDNMNLGVTSPMHNNFSDYDEEENNILDDQLLENINNSSIDLNENILNENELELDNLMLYERNLLENNFIWIDQIEAEKGILSIKSELCDGGTLSDTKHWKQYYVILIEATLLIFKPINKKEFKFKGWYDLLEATIKEADKKHSKKNNVFIIHTKSNLSPLFLTEDESSFNNWFNSIYQHINSCDLNFTRSSFITSIIKLNRNHCLKLINKNKDTGDLKFNNNNKSNILTSPKSNEEFKSSKPPNNQRKSSKLMGKFFHKSSNSTSSIPDDKKYLITESDSVWFTLIGDNDNVAYVPKRCIEELNSRQSLSSHGIYRLSGNSKQIKDWKLKFINIGPVSLASEPDINTITGILKFYFRELKEPLIPYDAYEMIIEASKIQDYDTRLLEFKEILLSLDAPNLSTLQFLISHLQQVSEFKEINMMDANNLAIVFAPTIARPKDPNLHPQLQPFYMLLESLILQFKWFFDLDIVN